MTDTPPFVILSVCLDGDMGAMHASVPLAAETGAQLWTLVVGRSAKVSAASAAAAGADRVFVFETDLHAASRPEEIASACSAAITAIFEGGSFQAVCVFSAAQEGDAVAGMVAADLGFACAGRLIGVTGEAGALTASRSAYGGRLQLVTTLGGISCTGVVQPPKHAPQAAARPGVPVRVLDIVPKKAEPLPCSSEPAAGEDGFDLASARLVFSGGRGLDEEGFALLAQLARTFGGAVGASLPAVDLGLAPVSWQVGQSGKFVSPDIYVAVGMSGTPQHLAGISDETRVFAINNDPDAQIFHRAEYGVVADWKDILPELVKVAVSEALP